MVTSTAAHPDEQATASLTVQAATRSISPRLCTVAALEASLPEKSYSLKRHGEQTPSFAAKLAVAPVSAKTLLRVRPVRHKNIHLLRNVENQGKWLRLPTRGVHELVGAAGTGKTQIALTSCLQVAQAQKKAIYLTLKHSTTQKIAQRLASMTAHSSSEKHLLQSVILKPIVNKDQLMETIAYELPTLLVEQTDVIWVVLDSVADIFRQEMNLFERSRCLFSLSAALYQLADQFGCACLCLNQVSLGESHPALGLAWAHCHTTSMRLSKQSLSRTLVLCKSPYEDSSRNHKVSVAIDARGVSLVPTDGNLE